MTAHGPSPARPAAAWISRYAAGLLSSTPGLQPLDAVRLAMDTSAGTAVDRAREASNLAVHPGAKRASLRDQKVNVRNGPKEQLPRPRGDGS